MKKYKLDYLSNQIIKGDIEMHRNLYELIESLKIKLHRLGTVAHFVRLQFNAITAQ